MNGGEDEVVDKFREYSNEISEKMTSKSVLSEIFTFDPIKLPITWWKNSLIRNSEEMPWKVCSENSCFWKLQSENIIFSCSALFRSSYKSIDL